MLQAILPNMIKKKEGHFVVISSAAAIAPVGNEVPYSMTKAALTCEFTIHIILLQTNIEK